MPNGRKKVAFVSSFGKSKLDLEEVEKTKEYLKEYNKISVREDSAVCILNDLGYSSISLIDPTLQVTKQEWLEISSKRLIKERYLILMLLYNEDNGATEYARKIADEKNLKLVKISWELLKPKMIDKLMTHRTPQDFLSLFYYAEFVVTNSFHGLAFSINFNKQFIVVPRNEFNTRIESLLRLVNLEGRLISDAERLSDVIDVTIDYKEVEQILSKEREKSKLFIEENISCF